MVVTGDYQCEVCGKITRIRVQLGWLNTYPIRIKCGECSIPIYGKVELQPLEGTYDIDLSNVKITDSKKQPDFIIEVSGELLTEKLKKFTNSKDNLFSPFFKNALWTMGEDNLNFFKRDIISFINDIRVKWPFVRRINELWLSGNHKYLKNEIHKVFNKTEYPADNELEYLRAVHGINIRFFSPITKLHFKDSTDLIFKILKEAMEKNPENYKELILNFDSKLNVYEQKIYLIMCNFIEKFPMILPILGLEYYEEQYKDEAIKRLGLTTVNFEDIKDFYIETFEDIIEIFDLIIAYENLLMRTDFTEMDHTINNQIKTLTDFQTKMNNKGRKLEFINSLERLDKILHVKIDNKLRNAIGHRSYEYEVESQKIIYFSSGIVGKGIQEELYLNEFVIKCLDLFRTVLNVGEIVYQTRKNSLVFKGGKIRSITDYYPKTSNSNWKNINSYSRKSNMEYRKKKNKLKAQKKARKISRRRK